MDSCFKTSYKENMRAVKILWDRVSSTIRSPRLPLIFVGVGILLRTKHYFENPSFWGDEAWLANAVMRRPFKDILLAVNIDRHDPLGFHLIEKSLISVWGTSEFIFRLFPFICSLGSIILFYFLAKRYLQPQAVVIAVGLFALCDQLIFYAAESHPYSSDVLITLVMLLCFAHLKDSPPGHRPLRYTLHISIGGSLFIWLSYPSIFILTGIGLIILANGFSKKNRQTLRRFMIPMGFWALSFLIYYAHYLHPVTHKAYMKTFMMNLNPHPFPSTAWMKIFFHSFLAAFETPLGLIPPPCTVV